MSGIIREWLHCKSLRGISDHFHPPQIPSRAFSHALSSVFLTVYLCYPAISASRSCLSVRISYILYVLSFLFVLPLSLLLPEGGCAARSGRARREHSGPPLSWAQLRLGHKDSAGASLARCPPPRAENNRKALLCPLFACPPLRPLLAMTTCSCMCG